MWSPEPLPLVDGSSLVLLPPVRGRPAIVELLRPAPLMALLVLRAHGITLGAENDPEGAGSASAASVVLALDGEVNRCSSQAGTGLDFIQPIGWCVAEFLLAKNMNKCIHSPVIPIGRFCNGNGQENTGHRRLLSGEFAT